MKNSFLEQLNNLGEDFEISIFPLDSGNLDATNLYMGIIKHPIDMYENPLIVDSNESYFYYSVKMISMKEYVMLFSRFVIKQTSQAPSNH